MLDFFEKYRELEKSLLLPDKIEIGTPGRGGVISVHGNFDDPAEGFRKRIENAIMLRDYAKRLYYEQEISDRD